ncbi:MAG: hypothetical protein ACI3ZP_03600 [Candidatus Cryptobacteroides sp.]
MRKLGDEDKGMLDSIENARKDGLSFALYESSIFLLLFCSFVTLPKVLYVALFAAGIVLALLAFVRQTLVSMDKVRPVLARPIFRWLVTIQGLIVLTIFLLKMHSLAGIITIIVLVIVMVSVLLAPVVRRRH